MVQKSLQVIDTTSGAHIVSKDLVQFVHAHFMGECSQWQLMQTWEQTGEANANVSRQVEIKAGRSEHVCGQVSTNRGRHEGQVWTRAGEYEGRHVQWWEQWQHCTPLPLHHLPTTHISVNSTSMASIPPVMMMTPSTTATACVHSSLYHFFHVYNLHIYCLQHIKYGTLIQPNLIYIYPLEYL